MPPVDGEPTEAMRVQFNQRLAALLDSIPTLAKAMDTRSLEEHISRAMFAADANGRMQSAPVP